MDKHKDTTSSQWQKVMNIYGVGSRSAFDMSLAVRDIIDELGKAFPGIKCGNNLENQFTFPPLEYIFVKKAMEYFKNNKSQINQLINKRRKNYFLQCWGC